MGFKDNPVIYLIRKSWKYSDKKKVVLFYILFFFSNMTSFLWPLVIGKSLNIIQFEGLNYDSFISVLKWFSLIIVLTFVFWAFHGPARVIENRNAFLVRARYKKYLLDGVLDLPAGWHTDNHSGDTIDRIDKGSKGLFEFAKMQFVVIENIIRLLSSFLILVYFNIHAGYIAAIIIVMAFWIIVRFDRKLIPQYEELNRRENSIGAKVFDIISNITTVIILRLEKMVSTDMYRKIMKPFGLYKRTIVVEEIKWFLISVCGSLMIFLILASYLFMELRAGSVVAIGTMYILFGYVERINNIFFRFAQNYGQFVLQRTDVRNAEEVSDNFNRFDLRAGKKLKRNWKEFEADSIYFKYENDSERYSLNGVSIRFRKGEKIALIGESGSGKTTILRILRQLYNMDSGDIKVDGKPVKGGLGRVSDSISLIPQEPEIFATTIIDNITLGINYPLKEVTKYSDIAKFTMIVDRLPKGWNSSIVEKGVNLSGGEKQRLALARGLLASRDKEIILMDESTSSVDPRNEKKIFESVFKEFKGKTVLSALHRLHLLPMFDRIYIFDQGGIVANGTYEELKKESKLFKKMLKRSGLK